MPSPLFCSSPSILRLPSTTKTLSHLPPSSSRSRAAFNPPLCIARRATLHSTGASIQLHPLPENPSADLPLFIVCPNCHRAYHTPRLTSPTSLRCAHCTHVFLFDTSALLTSLPPSPTSLSACPHFSKCSGCTLSGPPSNPPVLARANALSNFLTNKPLSSVRMAAPVAWRGLAKLAVRQTDAGIQVGLFREGTHQVEPIPHCLVHMDGINQIIAEVINVMKKESVRGYDENSASGQVRYIIVSMARDQRALLTLVWNSTDWKGAQPKSMRLAVALRKGKQKHKLAGIWMNWNAGTGNVILHQDPSRFYHAWGQRELKETIMGVTLYFGPHSFRQANLDAFENLVLPQILRYIPTGCNVAEFYAGVGVIGLVALKHKRLQYLVASEANPNSENAFWKAYTELRKEAQLKGVAEFIVGTEDETTYMVNDDIDMIILDPPRAGLTETFAQWLSKGPAHNVRRILYLSCGFDAFERDSKILCNGVWDLKDAQGFILFPGSNHVETLGVFDRKQDGRERRLGPRRGGKQMDSRRNDRGNNRSLGNNRGPRARRDGGSNRWRNKDASSSRDRGADESRRGVARRGQTREGRRTVREGEVERTHSNRRNGRTH